MYAIFTLIQVNNYCDSTTIAQLFLNLINGLFKTLPNQFNILNHNGNYVKRLAQFCRGPKTVRRRPECTLQRKNDRSQLECFCYSKNEHQLLWDTDHAIRRVSIWPIQLLDALFRLNAAWVLHFRWKRYFDGKNCCATNAWRQW